MRRTTRRWLVLAGASLSLGLGGCSPSTPSSPSSGVTSSPASEAAEVAGAAETPPADLGPLCGVEFYVATEAKPAGGSHGHDHDPVNRGDEGPPKLAPFSDLSFAVSASRQVDATEWKGVARVELKTDSAGRVQTELPCGTQLELRVPHWIWPSAPDSLVLDTDMAKPVTVMLRSAIHLRLWVQSSDGKRLEDARVFAAGDEEGRPIPIEGLLFEGVGLGQELGEIRAEGFAPHPWTPSQSDVLETPGPEHYEATVKLGAKRSWVRVGDGARHLSGLWCLEAGEPGAKCTGRLGNAATGSWMCPCLAGTQVAFASDRWDVGVVRTIPNPLERRATLPVVPEPIEVCIEAPSGLAAASVRLHPQGIRGSLALSTPPKALGGANKLCLTLPQNEPVDVDGGESGRWTIRPTEAGSTPLQP